VHARPRARDGHRRCDRRGDAGSRGAGRYRRAPGERGGGFRRRHRTGSADVQRGASRGTAALRSGPRGHHRRSAGAQRDDLRVARARAGWRCRAAAYRLQRGHVRAHPVRRPRAGLRNGRAHGCAAARSGRPVRALREPHPRRRRRRSDRIARAAGAGHSDPDGRARRTACDRFSRRPAGDARFAAGRQARVRARLVARAGGRRRNGRRAACAAQVFP